MEEIWKDVKGYEDLYQVSNIGRVKSLARLINNKNGYSKRQGVILKPSLARYYAVALSKNDKQKSCYIHRLVADAFIDNPEDKPQVNHIGSLNTISRKIIKGVLSFIKV